MPTIYQASEMQETDKRPYQSVTLPNIVPLQPDLPHIGNIFLLAMLRANSEMDVMADLVEKNASQFSLAKPIRAPQPSACPPIQGVVHEDFDPCTTSPRSGMIQPSGLLYPYFPPS